MSKSYAKQRHVYDNIGIIKSPAEVENNIYKQCLYILSSFKFFFITYSFLRI